MTKGQDQGPLHPTKVSNKAPGTFCSPSQGFVCPLDGFFPIHNKPAAQSHISNKLFLHGLNHQSKKKTAFVLQFLDHNLQSAVCPVYMYTTEISLWLKK